VKEHIKMMTESMQKAMENMQGISKRMEEMQKQKTDH
jgi:hypothetical protein